MNTMKNAAAAAKLTIIRVATSQGETRFGTPVPRLTLTWARNDGAYRAQRAALLRAAAAVEEATPAADKWCVQIGEVYYAARGEEAASIEIELVDGTPAEAKRAMATLAQVAKTLA